MKTDMNPNEQTQRHILLCVAGLTPQIVTEILYALTQQRGEHVDEIRVITTSDGWEKITRALLDPNHGQFFAFCRDYQLDPTHIKFDKTMIALLRTPTDAHSMTSARSMIIAMRRIRSVKLCKN